MERKIGWSIIRRATKKKQKEWIKEMERKQKNESNKRRMDKDSDRKRVKGEKTLGQKR